MVTIQHPRLGMLNNYMNDYKLVTIRMRMSGGSCPSCIMAVPMSRHGVRIPEDRQAPIRYNRMVNVYLYYWA